MPKRQYKYICKHCDAGTNCPNNICYKCSGKLGVIRKIKRILKNGVKNNDKI